MYAQVEKPKTNTSRAGWQKSRAVANSVAQMKNNGKQGFGFVDNRPAAIAQRKLQELGKASPAKQASHLQAQGSAPGTVQRKCTACDTEEQSIQRISSTAMAPIQRRGSVSECEDYHADYKAKKPKKCTQNHTKAEMEANVIATQAHIDGRQLYIDEECDYVLQGSINKGSAVALASHRLELAGVNKTLSNCNYKILKRKYKKV